MARKFNPDHWKRLVSEQRRALLSPDSFLDLLGIEPGAVVADLGAGPGFFTLPLAVRVGPAGRVFAVDVAPEMVRVLKERDLPATVEVMLSGENRTPILKGSVDLALLAFVLHELDDAGAFLKEVRRILKPAGRFVVLEWVPQEEELGPPMSERLAEAESTEILRRNGFEIVKRGDANASNYFIVARSGAPAPANEAVVATPMGGQQDTGPDLRGA